MLINAIAAFRRGAERSRGGEGKCSLAEVINSAEIQCREETSSAGFA